MNSEWVESAKLIEVLGRGGVTLTERRLRQLADDGFFPQPQRGKFHAIATLVGLVRFYRESRKREGGSLAEEKLRKLREEADRIALENEKTRGQLVETEAVFRHFEKLFIALRQKILASHLSDGEKDDLLRELREVRLDGLLDDAGRGTKPARAEAGERASAGDSDASAAAQRG